MAAFLLAAGGPFWAQDLDALVIEGGTLIDGLGGPPMEDVLIVIEAAAVA